MVIALGDIPGGALAGTQITLASVASNGAAASVAHKWRAPQAVKVVSAWWAPDTVNQSSHANSSASYRRLTLINGGQVGAGTTVIGSLNLSASLASLATRAMTLASAAQNLAAGDVLIFSHSTVGGDLDDGTVLRAGTLYVNYRPISPA